MSSLFVRGSQSGRRCPKVGGALRLVSGWTDGFIKTTKSATKEEGLKLFHMQRWNKLSYAVTSVGRGKGMCLLSGTTGSGTIWGSVGFSESIWIQQVWERFFTFWDGTRIPHQREIRETSGSTSRNLGGVEGIFSWEFTFFPHQTDSRRLLLKEKLHLIQVWQWETSCFNPLKINSRHHLTTTLDRWAGRTILIGPSLTSAHLLTPTPSGPVGSCWGSVGSIFQPDSHTKSKETSSMFTPNSKPSEPPAFTFAVSRNKLLLDLF